MKIATRYSLVALVVFAFVLCTAAAQAQKISAGAHELAIAPPAAWVERLSMPVARGHAGASLTVLLADTQLRAQPGSPEQYVRRVLHARDAAALDQMSQIQIAYNPAYQRITLHAVRIIRDGSAIDRTSNTIVRLMEREEQMGARVYSGIVSVAIIVDGLRVSDLLEYEYTLHGQNPVFRDRYVDNASLIVRLPVEYRRVRLIAPQNRKIGYKVHGAHVAARETVRDGWRETTWEARDLAPVIEEDRSPLWYNPYGWIQFTEFTSWGQVSDWALDLYPQRPLSAELTALVEKFRTAGGTDEQRTIAALRFVQEDIRYFAIAFGESSHRPNAPEETLRRRLGDCKDKTLLLITLLRGLGIEARPVLVSTSSGKAIEDDLPSPLAFDHVIAAASIGGTTFWLDPTITSQRGPLRLRSQFDYLGKGLVVERGRNALTPLVRPRDAANAYANVHEKFVVKSFEAPADLTVTSIFKGGRAERVREALLQNTREGLERYFINDLASRYPKIKALKSFEVRDSEHDNTLSLIERYEVPGFMELVEERWIGRLAALTLEAQLRLPSTLQRKSPLVVEHPVEIKYSFQVQLPQTVSVMQDPSSRRVRNPYFEVIETSRFRGNVYAGEVSYRSLADSVPAADMGKFAADVKSSREALFHAVWIPRRTLALDKQKATGASLEAKLRERQIELVRRITQVIDSKRLSGDDLAEAHYRRGLARSSLEQYDAALADLDSALKLNPSHRDALTERAAMLIYRGDYEKALSNLTHALTVGADPEDIYAKRGQALFYLGRLGDAAEQFRRAVTDSQDAERVVFHMLWYGWAATRAKIPLAPEVETRMKQEAGRSEWPRPALGLILGSRAPDDVIRAAEAPGNPDATQMNLCEAYYSVGQYYLARGDRDKAKDAFGKARATGVILYLEYIYAKKELALLSR